MCVRETRYEIASSAPRPILGPSRLFVVVLCCRLVCSCRGLSCNCYFFYKLFGWARIPYLTLLPISHVLCLTPLFLVVLIVKTISTECHSAIAPSPSPSPVLPCSLPLFLASCGLTKPCQSYRDTVSYPMECDGTFTDSFIFPCDAQCDFKLVLYLFHILFMNKNWNHSALEFF